jgi:hypothetical protein
MAGFIIIEEHIVDILLRENNLEDDCHQNKGIGNLIRRGLS